MPLLMADIAFDLGDVFLFLLDNISIYTCFRGVMAVTSLAPLVLKTFLVVLVFFGSLALVDERLLMFAIGYVNRRSVSGLNLFRVFLFLLYGFVLLETL